MGECIIARRGTPIKGFKYVGVATVSAAWTKTPIFLDSSSFSGIPILPGDELLGTYSSWIIHGHCVAEGEETGSSDAAVGKVAVHAYANLTYSSSVGTFDVYRKTGS